MKIINPFYLLLFALTILGCSKDLKIQQQEEAVLIPVHVFIVNYQPGSIATVAPYVTPHFRRQQSRLEWIAHVEGMLESFGYERLDSEVTDLAFDGEMAVVTAQTKISTIFGKVAQKEVFRVVLDSDGWKIDGLQIVDEVIEQPKIEM